MGAIQYIGDKFANVISGLGTSRDKATGGVFTQSHITEQELRAAFDTNWLARKIVTAPVMDATRKWRNWQADPEQITAIEAEEQRLGFKRKVAEARIKARLHGGAALLIGADGANAEEPLDPLKIGRDGLEYLTVVTRHELTEGDIVRDPASDSYGKPADYQIDTESGLPTTIHPSRVVIFTGVDRSDSGLPQTGWGISALVPVYEAVKNATEITANVNSLVYEAKTDVINIPQMASNLASGGKAYETKLADRLRLAMVLKGINGALVLDGDETYTQKSASFAQLPQLIETFMQVACGAADIPATRLLGKSAAGLQSTGDGDERTYYDRIESDQELLQSEPMRVLDECLIVSALGSRPPEIHYRWAPLRQISEQELAEIGVKQANAAKTNAESGLFPRMALAKAVHNQAIETGTMPGLEGALGEEGEFDLGGDDDALVADAASRTLYVSRKVLNAAEILAWAKAQGFTSTLDADDLHVTITYSRRPVDWMEMGEAWQSELKIAAGGARLMERFGDARVLLFKSSELDWRHQDMVKAGATWDHPEYQSHITISYDDAAPDLANVTPYQGEIVLGPEIFAEVDEDWAAKATA